MKMKVSDCDQCPRQGVPIAKSLPSSGRWCVSCNHKRLEAIRVMSGKPMKKPMSKLKKATGEQAMFFAIWESRAHISFLDGAFLGNDAQSWFFAHVLPKGKYPEFRLNMNNIVLLTQEQHFAWDQKPRSELIDDPKWRKMFELEEKLKNQYNKQK